MTTRAERRLQLRAFADPERHRHEAEHRRERRHQDRPQPDAAGSLDGLAKRHTVAPSQHVRVVDEQDGVADDDAGEHDDADVGLQAERGAGQLERQHHADGRRAAPRT